MRVQSGLHLQRDSKLAPVSASELLTAQQQVSTFVQAAPRSGEHWQHAILLWVQMPPETRTTSPWTTEPLRVAAGRWFMGSSIYNAANVIDSLEQASWHPLEPVSLARLQTQPTDKTDAAAREGMIISLLFLARLTLKRLREADEKLYGRDTLAEYAALSAKIMHEELHLDHEALEAIAFALERTPKDKQQSLLDLKTTIEQTP